MNTCSFCLDSPRCLITHPSIDAIILDGKLLIIFTQCDIDCHQRGYYGFKFFLYIYKWSDYDWQPKLDFNSLLCNGRGKRVPILLTLECLIDGGTTANIKTMILVFFIMYDGLTSGQTIECVVCLGLNGISKFEGIKFRIIVWMMIQQAPYFIHPMMHRMNLTLQI